MPLPRRAPPPRARQADAQQQQHAGVLAVASCVWNQYFPQDHHIGIARPGDTRGTNYYSLVSESEGRFKAALAFRDCFRDREQWAPLLTNYELTEPDVTVVWLNYAELIRSAAGLPDFERVLQENVEDVIPCLGIALCMLRHELRQEQEDTPARQCNVPLDRTKISVRLHGITPVLPIAALKADVVNQFVSVMGTVVRVSAIKPLVTRCDFVCVKCNEVTSRAFPDGKYNPPMACEISPCRSRTLVPNRSTVETVDFQKIKIQEMENSDAGPGRIPRMIEVELYEDLVDSCIPGNVVTVSGVVKSINSEVHSGRYGKRAQTNSLYILYLSANSVENSARADADQDKTTDIDFTKEDLEQISNIISQGDVFDRLVHSLCPGIYRNEIVKAGLMLALLGGARNPDEKETACFSRSDSHVLVVGDPGLGKSQMLRAVAMVAPRAVYVGGNTTTTTGLTVTMVKDSSGDYALEAGALVLADQGVCCIDEFDKMGIDYQALLEAMEQQSISIAKAGIVANLTARTSVIAAANPSGGHYNRSRSVGENLKMKAALLSRFDLVFILLDRPDEERDRLLSEHIMNVHARDKRSRKRSRESSTSGSWRLNNDDEVDEPKANHRLLSHRLMQNAHEYTMNAIPTYFLKKFIAYARRYVHPRLSPEAASLLQKKYLELRAAGESNQNAADSIPITTRQLESLIRLSQARAKADFSEVVTEQHAQDVVDIMQECLLDTYITEDGNLDFGRSGGMSLAKKVKAYVARLMKTAQRKNTTLFSFEDLFEVANSMALQVDDFRDFVDILRNECYILKKGPQQYKVQVSSYSQM
uniref:DNA helicase n=1 Tax=Globisporangium ultimum (strain ATCC 200006 / CBS 805.95 / DAOM BR144) TaxID=431595 RepID=K3X799_GLOUD